MKEIENNDFKEVLEQELAVVDFYAHWCGPCRMQSPIIDEFSNKHSEVSVYKLNVDNNRETAVSYGIRNIPTICVFKNGQLVHKEVGLQSLDALEKLIK